MDSVGLLIFALALSSPAMATEAASVDIGEEIFDRWHIIPFEALNASIYEEPPPVIIDARNRTEVCEQGLIPHSTCIPLHEIETAFTMEPSDFEASYGIVKPTPEQWDLVITCKSGVRAMKADEILRTLGYRRQRVYEGSYNEWIVRG